VTSLLSPALADYLFYTTADGVLVLNARGLIARVNPAACSMLGVTVEEVLGRSPDQVFQKNPALLTLMTGTAPAASDIRLPRRRLAQGIASQLGSGERVILLQDVTERRDLEDRREALVRAIAHDLRNPVSAIGGFIDLVGRTGPLNDAQRKFLTRARQTVNKINDMVTSLVDLAWIEAGMPMQHIPIMLDQIIERAVRKLEALAAAQGVGIVLSIQHQLPPIMGDPERLELALYHIIQNALQYTLEPEKNVVIHAWSDSHEIYCNIADQGIGIPPQELKLVFERMYRGRDERINEIPGGGLGLTIARTIIRRHGGDVWANNNVHGGTTVSFVLPLSV
jgi:signal transduction histidine kinase